jgi:NAD(P)-dependent dehydrogenase (short-subunit alcohol dehydrogenase family)
VQRDVVLVTGGNSGIGYEAARALARAGWHVLLASRNRSASAAAAASIERESGAGCASELGVDLASLASVRQLAKEVEARGLPLRALNPVYPGISTAPRSGGALANLVVDPALEGVTGRYFPSTARWREAPSSAESYDAARARALSARLAGLAADESPLASA